MRDVNLSGMGLKYNEIKAIQEGQFDETIREVHKRNRRILIFSYAGAVVMVGGLASVVFGPRGLLDFVMYSGTIYIFLVESRRSTAEDPDAIPPLTAWCTCAPVRVARLSADRGDVKMLGEALGDPGEVVARGGVLGMVKLGYHPHRWVSLRLVCVPHRGRPRPRPPQ
jgi:hypothetical protein